jgi:hypothetical protein
MLPDIKTTAPYRMSGDKMPWLSLIALVVIDKSHSRSLNAAGWATKAARRRFHLALT